MVSELKNIQKRGWTRSIRPLNSGGIGNTIDHLLGLPENNLPIADTAQWELKTHRLGSTSLLTLFHMEPEPRQGRIVSNLLLPSYGWADQTRPNELSFRQTLTALAPSDRGFGISVNRDSDKLVVYFDAARVDPRHGAWLVSVDQRIGIGALSPEPYWGFQDLSLKASTKLLNSFYVEAETTRTDGEEHFRISRIVVLQGFDIDKFITAIDQGFVLVDFDARTHHNHGTKFRLRQNAIPSLYRYVEES